MPKLSSKQLAALKDIANLKAGFSCQGRAGQFIDAWIVAETVAKRLITYRTQKDVGEIWKWPEVESSLKYFEVSMPDDLLTKNIFAGGPGRKVDRTPRQLRNAFLHGVSDETMEEMDNKGKIFSKRLNEWLVIVTQG